MEELALEGIEYHWGRNRNHAVAKNVEINGEKYEVFINAVNTKENHINTLSLIYNTNNEWGRSGNPGFLGRVFYNVGYCNFLSWYEPQIFFDNWGYIDVINNKVDEDFKYTSAHELGHTILTSYRNAWYSFTHDGSSYIFQTSNDKESYKRQKEQGEINLMHYFNDDPSQSNYDYNLIIASEKDLLGLLWLSKIDVR